MRRPTRTEVLAVTSAAVPFAVSLAANLAWGIETNSVVLIALGVVTPIVLVLAVERWRRLPEATGAEWWLRTIAMSGVVVVVAGWSWLHTVEVLLAALDRFHGPAPVTGFPAALRVVEAVLVVLSPVPFDGLAVLSVLAMSGPDRTTTDRTSEAGPDRTGDQTASTGRKLVLEDGQLIDLLRTEKAPLSRNEVMRRHGVGATRAERLLAAMGWDDDRTGGADRSGPVRTGPAAGRVNGHPVGAR